MQSMRVAAPESDPSGSSRRGISRYLIWLVTIVVLAAVGYLVYQYTHPAQPTVPPVSALPVRTDSIVAVVHGTGQVAPWNDARLSFQTTGRITALPVRVGDQVKKGDVLASLDVTQYQIQLAQAKANLASAQAKLEAVQAGPRPEDIAVAQALRDAAQAKLDGMLAGGRTEQVKAAQAALAGAQARLHEVQQGAQAADVAAAKSGLEQAQATLSKDQASLAALTRPVDPLVVQQAQLAVDQAKSLLWKDQATRDAVCGNKAYPQATCDANNAQVAVDQTGVEQATSKLASAQEGAKPEDVAAAKAAVTSAQVQVDSANAKLAQLQAGSLPDDITQADASVSQAQQTLALQQHPYSESDIAQQKQAVLQAEATLALRKAPFTQADLDGAKAAVDQANAQVSLAQYVLDSAKLTAPFDGVISAVNGSVGEIASPNSATPTIVLVDPQDLRLDVAVDETDVARIQVGQNVTTTFDALPGKTFPAKVVAIAPNASVQSGVATYVASISLQNAPGVRPGMTGDADIVYAKHDNVVVVPTRVIRVEGNRHVVEVLQGKTVTPIEVTIGVSDDTNTEIVSGLKAGTQVVVPLTAPSLLLPNATMVAR